MGMCMQVTVILLHMFDPAELQGAAGEEKELEADVRTECERIGPVDKVAPRNCVIPCNLMGLTCSTRAADVGLLQTLIYLTCQCCLHCFASPVASLRLCAWLRHQGNKSSPICRSGSSRTIPLVSFLSASRPQRPQMNASRKWTAAFLEADSCRPPFGMASPTMLSRNKRPLKMRQ